MTISPEKTDNWEKEFDDRIKHVDGILQVKLLYTIGGVFLIFIIIWLVLIIWFREKTVEPENSANFSETSSTSQKINFKNSDSLK